MLNYLNIDITTINSGVLLHGCNCSGGFGSGVAGAIRKKWPEVYEQFNKNGTGEHLLGTIDKVKINPNLIVVNGYTQRKYGRDGQKYADLFAVRTCVLRAIHMAVYYKLPLYLPRIGCGLGGLEWSSVEQTIEDISNEFKDVKISICSL